MNHNTRSLPPSAPSLSLTPDSAKCVCERSGFSEFESISIDFRENGGGAAKENEGERKEGTKERKSDAPSPGIEQVRRMMNYVDFFSE